MKALQHSPPKCHHTKRPSYPSRTIDQKLCNAVCYAVISTSISPCNIAPGEFYTTTAETLLQMLSRRLTPVFAKCRTNKQKVFAEHQMENCKQNKQNIGIPQILWVKTLSNFVWFSNFDLSVCSFLVSAVSNFLICIIPSVCNNASKSTPKCHLQKLTWNWSIIPSKGSCAPPQAHHFPQAWLHEQRIFNVLSPKRNGNIINSKWLSLDLFKHSKAFTLLFCHFMGSIHKFSCALAFHAEIATTGTPIFFSSAAASIVSPLFFDHHQSY